MKIKIVSIMMIIIIIVCVLCMVGCFNETCEQCHKKKSCSTYVIQYNGTSEEGSMCSDCFEKAKEKYEAMGGTVEKK